MPKFFVSPDKVRGNRIIIDTEDVSHIKRVLRLSVGDNITVCDSCGNDYDCKIANISDKCVECEIISSKKNNSEPNIKVTLYQALPKATKMEYIIQKTTELGITKIVPCALSRCVVKLDEKDSKKKISRWQKIADEAAKQSGRGILPEISDVMSFRDAVDEMKNSDLVFVPYECAEDNTLRKVLNSKPAQNVAFMIGPEGGFSPEEATYLEDNGIPLVTLGKRILRTETAGMAVLSMVMYEIGDIN
ncbi:MAG: 16S rRNA (uracil(1498)-N(3))-methyltransferase [Eubacteriales bacterium]|nr:16S rRNA (uracil(1498)-N(3))-methyltransferase [Eubacteriales bacterium]